MQVAVVLASLFDDTRAFLRALAGQPEVRLTLARGDADPLEVLRAVRGADRLWLEGLGLAVADLSARPAAAWLPPACLRIGPADLPNLACPTLWRLVRTVVAPDRATAERVRALLPRGGRPRIQVRLDVPVEARVAALGTRGGDLHAQEWTAVLRLAERARGRVRLLGEGPPELTEVLTVGYGRELVEAGPAETRILWHAPPRAPVVHVSAEAGGEAPVPCGPPPQPGAEPPLVSAVVPAYNAAETIDRCLTSLRRQTYPNLEIVVIDDGSTDETAERVAAHLDDPRVRYFDTPHGGRPAARNRGIAEARGEWIAWLDADDEAMPNRIFAEVEAARAAGGADVVHADGLLLAPDGTVRFTRRNRPVAQKELPARLLAGLSGCCPILNGSTLVRRGLYDRLGGYDEAFPRCQDYEFWCRCAAAGDVRFVHVPVPVVKVYRGARTAEATRRFLDGALGVARRLVETVGEAALVDPVARDLLEPPALVIGRTLLETGLAAEGPADHPIFEEAERYLRRGSSVGTGTARAEAERWLEVLEAYRRHGAGRRPSGRTAAPAAVPATPIGGSA